MDTALLYVDTGTAMGAAFNTMDGSMTTASKTTPASAVASAAASQGEVHVDDFTSRTSGLARAGQRLSFGTYFNAFAASYWRRWTNVEKIRLQVATAGSGVVSIYRSNARGSLQHVETRRVSGDTVSTFELPLKPFGDGGWYWFDLVAGSAPLTLNAAEWQAPGAEHTPGSVTLEITTLNKNEFCLNNLRILANNPDALAYLKEVLIVDQGTKKVKDAPGFAEIEARFGGKLRMIHQGNLGGSGGFARGMYEAVQNDSDYVLLLDDDVVVEPESIVRMVTFADHCNKPTIVGGHMFDLYNRTVLHTFGETVNPYRFQPDHPIKEQVLGHDFARTNLRTTPWMHRRVDVDYNGWWMCLIPTKVIRDIGLSLPVFIKWDDAEYGVRAKAAGYNTVSLPGSAVWHITWADKDDAVDWQAYFHSRNRIITALLHSPYPHGGRVVREGSFIDVKHLISMQYFTAQTRVMALQDLLAGPGKLHEILAHKLPEIQSMRHAYSEAKFEPDPEAFPTPGVSKPPRRGRGFQPPSYITLVPWAAKTIVRHLTKPVSKTSIERPEARVAHIDNKWWRMSQYDSAVVTNADGTAASWYHRDPEKLRDLLVEGMRLNAVILKDWQRLSEEYRQALPVITSLEAWKETFDKYSEESK
ncbi:galactofuranosyltransferase GlfT2 [Arthrobacter sp. Sa2BUA2]|uniref:Galactofuranosyltransferase GlfT2 n=1 Tax=Arthrobacter pullicola TaxID=2762224 RepID=A0ABR8YJ06_9MICC|nr:glycosyltransferase [Arthrobacter pullicola]MBD8044208.1 galactofuranosyltransferase GlfT2 [Arthrobacter pullicola]